MAQKSTRFPNLAALAAAFASLAWILSAVSPAVAQYYERPPGFQFFGPWGPQYIPAPAPQPQVDYSRAPAPKKPETPPTTSIIVVGDGMADWLAYGLEDAFSDTPEIGIIRKHRTASGLIRYDSRNDQDWARVARDILAAEKPSAVVMLVGINDRQSIRERPGAKPASPAPAPAQGPDQQQQDAENPDVQIMAPESPRNVSGTAEFRSDRWRELYIRRIDETTTALKSKGVPVIWVGLPIVRGPKATADVSYLNDLFRAQAQKNGIIFVDVWEGFVDEGGKFTYQGPDVDGQTRRLRTADGVYFTKYGARKLAHFVEREIRRVTSIKALPVALPTEDVQQPSPGAPRLDGPAPRPVVGAVVPLTAAPVSGSEELVGSGSRGITADPIAARVLVKGEPLPAAKGRADDFRWNGETSAALQPGPEQAPEPPPAAVPPPPPETPARAAAPTRDAGKKQANQTGKPAADGERRQAQPRRAQTQTSSNRDDVLRPPAPVGTRAFPPFGWFR